MVLKIAIVDDDVFFLNDVRRITQDCLARKKIIANVDLFQNHQLLLYELEEGTYYDLYLLDIEMNDKSINGIEISKKIREKNENAIIIFITSHMKYTLEAFKVTAFRYLPKNNLSHGLREALIDALNELTKKEGKFYLIETITKYIKLYHKDIYYIYKVGKYSVFACKMGEYRVRKSLAVVFKEMNSEEFIFVERGFIANITHIDRMEDAKIFMDDNESIIKVGRPQVNKVRDKIAAYWSEHI